MISVMCVVLTTGSSLVLVTLAARLAGACQRGAWVTGEKSARSKSKGNIEEKYFQISIFN